MATDQKHSFESSSSDSSLSESSLSFESSSSKSSLSESSSSEISLSESSLSDSDIDEIVNMIKYQRIWKKIQKRQAQRKKNTYNQNSRKGALQGQLTT